jgi:hypothetical protein
LKTSHYPQDPYLVQRPVNRRQANAQQLYFYSGVFSPGLEPEGCNKYLLFLNRSVRYLTQARHHPARMVAGNRRNAISPTVPPRENGIIE